jgi:hypothetical protein
MAPKLRRPAGQAGLTGTAQIDLLAAFAKQAQSPRKQRAADYENNLALEVDDIEISSEDEGHARPKKRARQGEQMKSLSTPSEEAFSIEMLPSPKDLAVHPKKIEQVRSWLEAVTDGMQGRLLLLIGPSGAGKSTVLRVLARQLDYQLVEWQNPMSTSRLGTDSLSAAFDRFLSTADRYTALLDGFKSASQSSHRLVLIEDLPNIYQSNTYAEDLREAFRKSLLRYLQSPRTVSPTVIIISESESRADFDDHGGTETVTARRLLGNEICDHVRTSTISFNAVADTYLRKALLAAADSNPRFRSRHISNALTHDLCQYANGDIRSALNSLELVFPALDTARPRRPRPKLKRGEVPAPTLTEQAALKLASGRELALDYRHALGKLLYNKHKAINYPYDAHRLNGSQTCPETEASDLVDNAAAAPEIFLAGAHRNYLASVEDVVTAAAVIDHLSAADHLPDRFDKEATILRRQFAIIAVSGIQTCLAGHRTRTDAKLFYPAGWQMWKDSNTSRALADRYVSTLPPTIRPRNMADILETLSCEARIHNSRKTSFLSQSRSKSLIPFQRLASFRQFGVSEASVVEESADFAEVPTQGANNPAATVLDDAGELDDEIEEVE